MTIAEYHLSGMVAFVTGAGRGIGKGIAQVLAEAGADVVINSLTDRHVKALAADIGRTTGRRVVPLVADVTKSDQVERAVGRILAEFGALHILVNNLGDSIRKPLVPPPGPGADAATPLTDEELRFILEVNLTATLLCSRAVGPHMLARRSSKVINIASFASARGGSALTITRRPEVNVLISMLPGSALALDSAARLARPGARVREEVVPGPSPPPAPHIVGSGPPIRPRGRGARPHRFPNRRHLTALSCRTLW